VRERLWHSTQRLRELPGGRLELTARVADAVEVRRWLLGFGAEAEVIAPVSLREALRAEAARLAAALAASRKPPARVEASGTWVALPSRRRRRPHALARRPA